MFDNTSPFETIDAVTGQSLQRTKGRARCTFKVRDGKTVLDTLGQSGSFKVRLPKIPGGGIPEAVLLNTAGGLTGGDRLSFEGGVAPQGHAIMTSQASERAYRSVSGPAKVHVDLHIGEGGRLDWLPQETILFDGAQLARTFDVDLAENATLLAHETVVFGRTAMSESIHEGHFSDHWQVRRGGRLVHADALRIDGDIQAALQAKAALSGATTMASILYVADDAETRDAALKDIADGISPADGIAGVSAWHGKLVIRAVAFGGQAMRRIITPLLHNLMDGRELPRVWSI